MADSEVQTVTTAGKQKIATEDGYATTRIIPWNGDESHAVEIRRKIVAGDRVPAWLQGEGETSVDVATREEEVGGAARGYTRNGEPQQPRDREAEEHAAPQMGMSEDELADATPADHRQRLAEKAEADKAAKADDRQDEKAAPRRASTK